MGNDRLNGHVPWISMENPNKHLGVGKIAEGVGQKKIMCHVFLKGGW